MTFVSGITLLGPEDPEALLKSLQDKLGACFWGELKKLDDKTYGWWVKGLVYTIYSLSIVLFHSKWVARFLKRRKVQCPTMPNSERQSTEVALEAQARDLPLFNWFDARSELEHNPWADS
ncbi:hypothetical protein GMOD_00006907 [Pyrenophora seminiperda CCB06]|uniref:Uncharacterized protein n=1 Tax=Pyrenophora seminiperda CCB06 TaxID=1302712 RepID=A0A3M7MBJ4_9PLEO|nr:hypothetical protein GMOD_00006907 [Pyrenophora seminiperda CCB06]